MTWPRDWAPPHVIAWRALWMLPVIASTALFCVLLGIQQFRSPWRIWREIR